MGGKRDFKGVWIPKEIWLSPDLDVVEKCLLVEIQSLDNEHGCYASNEHFAKFLGVNERTVQRKIKKLVDKGYITSKVGVVVKGSGQAFERVMRCKGKFARTSDKNLIEVVYDSSGAPVKVIDRRSK